MYLGFRGILWDEQTIEKSLAGPGNKAMSEKDKEYIRAAYGDLVAEELDELTEQAKARLSRFLQFKSIKSAKSDNALSFGFWDRLGDI